MNDTKLKVTFCAGAGTVTGANFLVESENKKFLIEFPPKERIRSWSTAEDSDNSKNHPCSQG